MDCTEVEEGYKVRYTPLVPGDYYISVKYNSYHIVGSPFKVTCSGMYSCEFPPLHYYFIFLIILNPFVKVRTWLREERRNPLLLLWRLFIKFQRAGFKVQHYLTSNLMHQR